MAVQQQWFSALVEGEYDYERPRRGDVCQAVILSVRESELLVDLGTKRDGIVPRTDLELLDESYRTGLQAGDHVPVYVLNPSERQDTLIVSLNQGLEKQDWLRAQELLDSEEICEAEVINANRGGVIVLFGRLRGFVPNSQLSSVRPRMRGERLWQAKHKLVGRTVSLVVIEVDQRRQRLVLSQRVARRRKSRQLLEELTEGDIRTGVVHNLASFGAFVDLGGLDGLIHISELDWKHVEHPSEVLSVGDEVEVYVLRVDREQKRVGLSRKRLLPDPWPFVVEGLHIGGTVRGTVTNVAEFGVFVDLGQGVEGLVHNSQLSHDGVSCAAFAAGSPITVRVLEIDHRRHRIALSLRGVAGEVEGTSSGSPESTKEPHDK